MIPPGQQSKQELSWVKLEMWSHHLERGVPTHRPQLSEMNGLCRYTARAVPSDTLGAQGFWNAASWFSSVSLLLPTRCLLLPSVSARKSHAHPSVQGERLPHPRVP